VWADSFWWAELEEELRENRRTDFRFMKTADRETAMQEMDRFRQQTLYPHSCSEECRKRGIVLVILKDN
jgi:hypothetical protein